MTYNELMADFGARLELEEFQPDADGLCEIHTDDFTVTFQHVPEANLVLTSALLCEIGPEPSAAFFRTLLESNFMYQRTRGATISVDPEANAVMLTRYDRLDQLDGERFFAAVERFMATLLEWQGWFAAAAETHPDAADEFVQA